MIAKPLNADDGKQTSERWASFRRPQRERLAWAARRLLEGGRISRADMIGAHEISTAQASLDLKTLRQMSPVDEIEYCTLTKAWRLSRRATA